MKLFVFLLLVLMTGCATTNYECFLGAGESILVTGETDLSLKVVPNGGFEIKAKDYKLGENLVIK